LQYIGGVIEVGLSLALQMFDKDMYIRPVSVDVILRARGSGGGGEGECTPPNN